MPCRQRSIGGQADSGGSESCNFKILLQSIDDLRMSKTQHHVTHGESSNTPVLVLSFGVWPRSCENEQHPRIFFRKHSEGQGPGRFELASPGPPWAGSESNVRAGGGLGPPLVGRGAPSHLNSGGAKALQHSTETAITSGPSIAHCTKPNGSALRTNTTVADSTFTQYPSHLRWFDGLSSLCIRSQVSTCISRHSDMCQSPPPGQLSTFTYMPQPFSEQQKGRSFNHWSKQEHRCCESEGPKRRVPTLGLHDSEILRIHHDEHKRNSGSLQCVSFLFFSFSLLPALPMSARPSVLQGVS